MLGWLREGEGEEGEGSATPKKMERTAGSKGVPGGLGQVGHVLVTLFKLTSSFPSLVWSTAWTSQCGTAI